MSNKHKPVPPSSQPPSHNAPASVPVPAASSGTGQAISLTSSVVALVVSLTVAYFSTLSAPDIRVFVSAPQWFMGSIQTGDYPNQKSGKQLAIKLTCAFSNHGARNGVIEDVMLRLESLDDSTRWLFYPGVQVDDAKFLSSDSPVPPTATKGLIGTFYPVSVPGKQSQLSTYLFLPMLKHPNFPFQDVKPHKFRVGVLARESGDQKWTTQQTFTADLSQGTLDFIQTGATLQQFPDELDQARRDIR